MDAKVNRGTDRVQWNQTERKPSWWRRRSLTTRRLVIIVPIVLIVAAFILVFPLGMMLMRGFPAQPAPAVSTITASNQAWQPQVEVIGSLTATRGADLAAEVAGVVDQVYYESGGEVRAGQPLIRLRSTDETARLATLQASAELAETTNARATKLWDIQGISRAEVDTAAASLKSARAAVAEQAALIEKKMVRAPFAGRLGIRNVNTGQYVNPGAIIATLQVLDPINLDFTVPQQMLERLQVGQAIEVRVDSHPNDVFMGKIETIDPKVNPGTRAAAIRATLANADGKLLPGMYATAHIETGMPATYITVPQTVVTFNPYGNTVFKVEKKVTDGKETLVATQAFVTTGETRGDQIAILTGVKEGDTLVSAGQFKLQNGATVQINNEVQPSNDPNPAPTER